LVNAALDRSPADERVEIVDRPQPTPS